MNEALICILAAAVGFTAAAYGICRKTAGSRRIGIAGIVLMLYLCAAAFSWLTYQAAGLPLMVLCAAAMVIAGMFIAWQSHPRNFKNQNRTVVILFVGYCLFVAWVTVFSRIGTVESSIHLQPLRSLWLAVSTGKLRYLWNDFLNILLFIPLGILSDAMSRKREPCIRCIILRGAIASLSIELIQLVTRLGVFDIDDIAFNTLGIALGQVLYRFIKHRAALWGRTAHKNYGGPHHQ